MTEIGVAKLAAIFCAFATRETDRARLAVGLYFFVYAASFHITIADDSAWVLVSRSLIDGIAAALMLLTGRTWLTAIVSIGLAWCIAVNVLTFGLYMAGQYQMLDYYSGLIAVGAIIEITGIVRGSDETWTTRRTDVHQSGRKSQNNGAMIAVVGISTKPSTSGPS